jgi:GrpB-like predicted nucleotidyltransferase (UPF0157 family)
MPTLVEIVAYNRDWQELFAQADAGLRHLLGAKVVRIDHVGSTAIPGMPAKPIIDIGVTVTGLHDIPAASVCLIDAGYEPRGNRYDEDVWAFLSPRSSTRLRVYLSPPGNQTHRRRLIFRDYLRSHDEAARAYADLKRQLAERFPYDGDRYTVEKSSFIADIVAKTED